MKWKSFKIIVAFWSLFKLESWKIQAFNELYVLEKAETNKGKIKNGNKRKMKVSVKTMLLDKLSVWWSLLKGSLVALPRKIVNRIRSWDSNLRGNVSKFHC